MVNKTSNVPQVNKSSILNSISLNTSRNRMSELFNDFKKLNINEQEPSASTDQNKNGQIGTSSKQKNTNEVTSYRTEGFQDNDSSIELVKVTMVKPKNLSALYVGDLDLNVTEEALYNHFKKFSSLSFVKICYAPNSKKSLGYGYVNFENCDEAVKAMDELNYSNLSGKEIRIMEALQGKDKHFSGTNVFISNLNINGLTSRSFYDSFKKYGRILSCKLDLQKRQGFILFEDSLVADKVVESLNGSILDGSKLYCAIHIPKKLREVNSNVTQKSKLKTHEDSITSKKFDSDSLLHTDPHRSEIYNHSPVSGSAQVQIETPYSQASIDTSNTTTTYSEPFREIYVKGLPVDCSETEVLKLFSCCGKIVGVFLENVPHFKSSWCLVTFEANESAINAVETYHKTLYKGRRLTCVKALKKVDRQIQLYHSAKKISDHSPSLKSLSNVTPVQIPSSYKLYLYNLPEGLNENFFKLFLRTYKFQGKILRYSINSSNNLKNYSFIEFENENDAKEVNAKFNGINIWGYVLVSALEKKNIGFGSLIKRTPSRYQEAHHSQFRPSAPLSAQQPGHSDIEYSVSSFPNPSSINLSPTTFPFGFQQQSAVQSARPMPYGSRIPTHVSISRTPSIKNEFFRKQTQKSESTFEKLQDYALQHIDFLIYPAATRENNLRRIVQYILDTCFENDSEKTLEFLKAVEFDPSLEETFKEKLVETIKLFGFER